MIHKLLIITLAVLSVGFTSKNMKDKNIKVQIEEQNQKGDIVFLVVSEGEVNIEGKAYTTSSSVADKYKNVEVLHMNANDSANEKLMAEYRLSNAPMPLVLILDSYGALITGLTEEQLREDVLESKIPTVQYSNLVKSLREGKATIIAAFNESDKDKDETLRLAEKSAQELGKEKATLVQLDLTDKLEKNFISMLGIKNTNKSIIIVVNKSGQLTGKFKKGSDVFDITSAAEKVYSGCGCS